jgi:2-(1,2-epoxy-1,2-dihydrophenyl)acetyl-CoA isomerase
VSEASALLAESRGAVTLLTLNRPERLNSLDSELLVRLRSALEVARDDGAVRAVVITGAGRGFSAGADLTKGPGKDVRTTLARFYAPVVRAIVEMETPVIAAVNGVAAGAGLSLALSCDLRVAARSARLIQAFVRIGLIPDAGGTYFLPRLVGLGRALEMAMLGDDLSAEEAARMGLVNRVVDDARCVDEAIELGRRLAEGPRSIGFIKRALRLSVDSDLAAQLQHEEDLQGLAYATEDFVEGVAAFHEKRRSRFAGR